MTSTNYGYEQGTKHGYRLGRVEAAKQILRILEDDKTPVGQSFREAQATCKSIIESNSDG